MSAIDDPGVRPRLREHAALVLVAEESVIYEADTGAIHKLDPIATLVCRLLDGHTTVDEVVDMLDETFGEERATIAADVTALLGDLVIKDVLVIGTPSVEGSPDGF